MIFEAVNRSMSTTSVLDKIHFGLEKDFEIKGLFKMVNEGRSAHNLCKSGNNLQKGGTYSCDSFYKAKEFT